MLGPGYRVLTKGEGFVEKDYFYWNAKEMTVEKYHIVDGVRNYGPQTLSAEDISLVYSVVVPHQVETS